MGETRVLTDLGVSGAGLGVGVERRGLAISSPVRNMLKTQRVPFVYEKISYYGSPAIELCRSAGWPKNFGGFPSNFGMKDEVLSRTKRMTFPSAIANRMISISTQ